MADVNPALGQGLWPFVFLFVAGVLATEPWRWLGVFLSRNLTIESEILQWVRLVSSALVAGLVTRMVLIPPGALGQVELWIRIAAFAIGLAVFLLARRILALGILAGFVALIVGQMVVG